MKKFLALLLALCMIFALAACGEAESEPSEAPASEAPASEAPAEESPAAESDLAYVQEKGTLIVGITEFEPMDYQDESGEWIGFDADLAKA
ncbi:MAG: amino acid ABC transporter substrate-binding protein, partial [Oscillospiraceae bacterium]